MEADFVEGQLLALGGQAPADRGEIHNVDRRRLGNSHGPGRR